MPRSRTAKRSEPFLYYRSEGKSEFKRQFRIAGGEEWIARMRHWNFSLPLNLKVAFALIFVASGGNIAFHCMADKCAAPDVHNAQSSLGLSNASASAPDPFVSPAPDTFVTLVNLPLKVSWYEPYNASFALPGEARSLMVNVTLNKGAARGLRFNATEVGGCDDLNFTGNVLPGQLLAPAIWPVEGKSTCTRPEPVKSDPTEGEVRFTVEEGKVSGRVIVVAKLPPKHSNPCGSHC